MQNRITAKRILRLKPARLRERVSPFYSIRFLSAFATAWRMCIRRWVANANSASACARLIALAGAVCCQTPRDRRRRPKNKRGIFLSVDAFRFVMFFHIAKRVSGGNPLAKRERVSPFIVFCFSIRVLLLSAYEGTPSAREREFCTRSRAPRQQLLARFVVIRRAIDGADRKTKEDRFIR